MEKNQIFENIMSRTSVRSYTDMPVEPEKVEMMLRAGIWRLHRHATKDKWKEENVSYNYYQK